MLRLIVAASLLLFGGALSQAVAQDASTCLAVNNAWVTPSKDQKISVIVLGFPKEVWHLAYNETKLLKESNGSDLRGARFTVRLFKGDQGSNGEAIGEAHMLWTFTPWGSEFTKQWQECRSGIWLVLVHE